MEGLGGDDDLRELKRSVVFEPMDVFGSAL